MNSFFIKLFNFNNFIKLFIIFFIGFFFRFLIDYFIGINVFNDYTSLISIIYYFFMSCFIVFVHELIDYLSYLPNFGGKIILGNFDSSIPSHNNKLSTPSTQQSIRTNKEIKVINSLNMENVNNTQNNNLNKSNNTRGNTPIDFRLTSNNGEDISMVPTINKDKKPVFLPYSNTNLSSISNHPSNRDVSITNVDNLNSNLGVNIRYPLDDIISGSEITSSELATPRVSLSSNNSKFTNDTNHGTVGTTSPNLPAINIDLNGVRRNSDFRLFEPRNISDIDIEYRRNRIRENVGQSIPDVINNNCTEIVVHKEGLFNKVKLGFKYTGSKVNSSVSKLESIYIKYHDIGKRKFFWTIWESNRDHYSSYQEFKKSWDPNTKIWKEIYNEIKRDISKEVDNLLHSNDPFKNKPIDNNHIKNILYNSRKKR